MSNLGLDLVFSKIFSTNTLGAIVALGLLALWVYVGWVLPIMRMKVPGISKMRKTAWILDLIFVGIMPIFLIVYRGSKHYRNTVVEVPPTNVYGYR